jgi:adenylate cyclase
LKARTGICLDNAAFGDIGTYRKIDFTAVGPTTNKAARLQGECVVGTVCIWEETYWPVKDDFTFADDNGREVTLKGIGTVRVWDVTGLKSRG